MGFNPLPILGGAAGFLLGGPGGAAVGAGIGGSVGGMFSNSSYPTMSDVNLARDNPELWKEMQNLQSLIGEYDKQYKARRQGATQGELAQMSQARGDYASKLGNLGLIGSSVGAQAIGSHDAQMQQALMDRIFQERQAMLNGLMQAHQGYANALNGGQNAALQGLQGAAQSAQQDEASKNNFYSGIFNAGMGQIGMNNYLDTMKNGVNSPGNNWNWAWGNPNDVEAWR